LAVEFVVVFTTEPGHIKWLRIVRMVGLYLRVVATLYRAHRRAFKLTAFYCTSNPVSSAGAFGCTCAVPSTSCIVLFSPSIGAAVLLQLCGVARTTRIIYSVFALLSFVATQDVNFSSLKTFLAHVTLKHIEPLYHKVMVQVELCCG
jgi:hypothetical protein